MSTSEQLEAILKLCCKNKKSEMASRTGTSKQAINSWFVRKRFPVPKVIVSFPELNPEWVRTGNGPMMRDPQLQNAPSAHERARAHTLINNEYGEHIKDGCHEHTNEGCYEHTKGSYEHTKGCYEHTNECDGRTPIVNEAVNLYKSSASTMRMITIPEQVLDAITHQLDVKDAQIERLLSELSRLRQLIGDSDSEKDV